MRFLKKIAEFILLATVLIVVVSLWTLSIYFKVTDEEKKIKAAEIIIEQHKREGR